MEFVTLLFALVGVVSATNVYPVKPNIHKKSEELCRRLMKDPFFEIDMVIGKPWRIYYTWNHFLTNRCVDITYKNATGNIIDRIWGDMNEYVEQQPNWEAATMLATLGRGNQEMLLLADQGPAGRFIGVPNVRRDPEVHPRMRGVPLLTFFMKLLREGKYLLMADCKMGIVSLSARPENIPYKMDLASVATELDIGEGKLACTKDQNKDEQIGTE